MTMVKNFGLSGVASTVQLGKGGATLGSQVDEGIAKDVVEVKDSGGDLTNLRAAAPIAGDDVVTKDWANGNNIVLGDPTDTSYQPGAVPLEPTTKVSDAVDSLNEILSKLIPSQPKNFPAGQSLTIAGAAVALLASGSVPDNTAGGVLPATAGQNVSRTATSTVSTGVIGAADDVGPGNSGRLELHVNGAKVDEQAFAEGAQNKTTGLLRISNDQAYPIATPGFWESFRSSAAGIQLIQGWNRIKMLHTEAQATPDAFVVLEPSTTPVVGAVTVAPKDTGTLAPSSGIPHYGDGGTIDVGLSASHLSLETYLASNVLSVSGGALATVNYKAGEAGLPSILPRNMATHNATVTVPVNGTVSAMADVTVTARNANGNGSSASVVKVLLNKGSAGNKVDEKGIPVTIAVNGGPSAGFAGRVDMSGGNFPSDAKSAALAGPTTAVPSDWDSAAAAESHDAAVVAGILKNDRTDYSTGYLPAGPNRSAFDADQYVTFAFRRTAVSKFDIKVTGTYSEMFVKLPGLTETNTSTTNGWLNMKTLYGGAGYAGDQNGANGSLGCALGAVANGSGSWTCTFGTLSTTNSDNNLVLVRFKLAAGQSITALSFVPPTR